MPVKFFYQKPFNIQPDKNLQKLLIYSSGGAVEITNKNLIEMITHYFKKDGQHISNATLNQWCLKCDLTTEDCINFLSEEANLLSEKKDSEDIHQEIILISEDKVINDLSSALSDITPYETIKIITEDPDKISKVISRCRKPMVILYMENYKREFVVNAYKGGKLSSNDNVSFSTSYYLHDSFIIDAIFSPKKNTPCHFCHHDMWYDQALNREFTSRSSWFSFYKKANEANWPINRALPVSKTDRHACFFYLKRKLSPFFGSNATSCYPEELVSFFQLRLPSGLSHSDIVPHSISCTCSGGKYVI